MSDRNGVDYCAFCKKKPAQLMYELTPVCLTCADPAVREAMKKADELHRNIDNALEQVKQTVEEVRAKSTEPIDPTQPVSGGHRPTDQETIEQMAPEHRAFAKKVLRKK